jgi:hypothetical protein
MLRFSFYVNHSSVSLSESTVLEGEFVGFSQREIIFGSKIISH